MSSQSHRIAPFSYANPNNRSIYDKRDEAERRRLPETRNGFVQSFEQDNDLSCHASENQPTSREPKISSSGKRHFVAKTGESFAKKRNLDSFLDEIKRDQDNQDRNEKLKLARMGNTGILSMDRDDIYAGEQPGPKTIQLSSLPLGTTEDSLRQLACAYGTISSFNILPLKTLDDATRKGITALLTFDSSTSADRAKTGLDGRYLGDGFRVKAQWGKQLSSAVRVDKSGFPFNAKEATGPFPNGRMEIVVGRPKDLGMMRRIHRIVEMVISNGMEFEAFLMSREKSNPQFEFLFNSTLPEHIYYRWRLFSILNSDSITDYRKEPFQMFFAGAFWVPPEPLCEDDDENSDDEAPHKGPLGECRRRRFEWLLRNVDYRRGSIARPMAFAIDHADAADEIVDIIIQSLMLSESEIRKKVARLWLVSDILHNSSSGVPNVWKYRQLFESRLPEVFIHLNVIHKSFDGRIKAENFRRQIQNITSIWESWIVFGQGILESMIELFLGREKGDEKDSCSKVEPVEEKIEKKSRGWKTIEDTDGEDQIEVSRIDEGENIDDDLDGVPLDGQSDEDIDGAPMDDIDGELMENFDDNPLVNETLDRLPLTDEKTEKRRDLLEAAEFIPNFSDRPLRKPEKSMSIALSSQNVTPTGRRIPKAEDMFADDDKED
ncbi:U2 snRNP-associated SURP motif-containing protein [Neolecta irregularis DAH-3]|uniref:U2 snRNP-associated SURP motif-containing protein n=1 Tax=Neolecta irregularis (strain DAH-3) TaxID=1198029 RepID=A0A1U7LNS8_NEOID|nr:U2 snRNP-associated SURP motif-containing protein [Neolecta irregularis DAH-3]|eukprot:OLL24289.1 U2 snRNP-associated SURP motif-containing protein [Neolecta irregularis DAH-3]